MGYKLDQIRVLKHNGKKNGEVIFRFKDGSDIFYFELGFNDLDNLLNLITMMDGINLFDIRYKLSEESEKYVVENYFSKNGDKNIENNI